MPHRQIILSGVKLDAIREKELIQLVIASISSGDGGFIVTHNLDHLRRLQFDTTFAVACDEATYRVADGMPLVWASRLRGTPLPERVAGSSLIHTLTAAAGAQGKSVFLIGGNPGTAVAAAARLKSVTPSLQVVGMVCPPVGFELDPAYFTKLVDTLRLADPDIVYLAVGSPKQELLAVVLRKELPKAWFAGVGISFSFVTGDVRRAPKWVQKSGLEWLHRLAQEPRRLAGRYLFQGLPFFFKLMSDALLDRLFKSRRNVFPRPITDGSA